MVPKLGDQSIWWNFFLSLYSRHLLAHSQAVDPSLASSHVFSGNFLHQDRTTAFLSKVVWSSTWSGSCCWNNFYSLKVRSHKGTCTHMKTGSLWCRAVCDLWCRAVSTRSVLTRLGWLPRTWHSLCGSQWTQNKQIDFLRLSSGLL